MSASVLDQEPVVLYDRMVNIWAARLWWMLRAFGFDNVALLNGGWAKWTAEARPTSTRPAAYPPAEFTARMRPELIASKEEVKAAINKEATCLVNALDPEEFVGRGPVRYGRPGLFHPASTCRFLVSSTPKQTPPTARPDSQAILRRRRSRKGPRDHLLRRRHRGKQRRLSLDPFGAKNVAVYDGSMTGGRRIPSTLVVD
jgi:thiosulfate/3-mercaptopyruvate sulfurtransferase